MINSYSDKSLNQIFSKLYETIQTETSRGIYKTSSNCCCQICVDKCQWPRPWLYPKNQGSITWKQ